MTVKIALLGFGTVASGVPFPPKGKWRKNQSISTFRDRSC